MKVGIFDSGIGGLTVLKSLKKRYPNNDYIYVGDNKNIPYGTKDKATLFKLSSNIIDFLILLEVDIIVIACGTVSSNVYDELKQKYNIKIIDIITPTISFINKSNMKDIGVLATPSTINSHIFKKLINKNVIEEPCSEFVPLIENNELNSKELKESINKHLSNINCDIVILGCTHYPLIKHLINKETIELSDNIVLDDNKGNGTIICYFSLISDLLINNVNNIIKVNEIRKW